MCCSGRHDALHTPSRVASSYRKSIGILTAVLLTVQWCGRRGFPCVQRSAVPRHRWLAALRLCLSSVIRLASRRTTTNISALHNKHTHTADLLKSQERCDCPHARGIYSRKEICGCSSVRRRSPLGRSQHKGPLPTAGEKNAFCHSCNMRGRRWNVSRLGTPVFSPSRRSQ